MSSFDSGSSFDEGGTFNPPLIPIPQPLFLPSSPPRITYFLTNVFTGEITAILPLTSVSFSLVLNGAGQFTGTLNVEDPEVAATGWIDATIPNQNALWVDIDGALVWGGIVHRRKYNIKGTVQIGADEFWSYFQQRIQAQDYTNTWATTPTGVAQIAWQVIYDAQQSLYTIPMGLPQPAATPNVYALTASYPLSQEQTIDSIVTELSGMGYPVGFDFGNDVGYVNGAPWPTLTLGYPRRGRPAGSTGLVLDISQALDFEWDEDGSQQGNQLIELSTGYGGVGSVETWAPSMTEDGYPLLQKVEDHMQISSTVSPNVTDLTGTPAMMAALGRGDLALYAYPTIAPEVTMRLFSTDEAPAPVPLGSFITGDDVLLTLPDTNILGSIVRNPRFPDGIDFYMRIIQADVTIADQGMSTVKFTLNAPPNLTPVRPPQ